MTIDNMCLKSPGRVSPLDKKAKSRATSNLSRSRSAVSSDMDACISPNIPIAIGSSLSTKPVLSEADYSASPVGKSPTTHAVVHRDWMISDDTKTQIDVRRFLVASTGRQTVAKGRGDFELMKDGVNTVRIYITG